MANTYTQLYIHIVIAVKGRQNSLLKPWRNELWHYMGGIVNGKKQKSFIINGVADHVHMLISIKPAISVSDLVRDVKNNSTNFINAKKFLSEKFCWQEGFSAFSVSQSNIDKVYQYILNQEEHHKNKSFKEEYLGLLKAYEVNFDEKYLFEFYNP